MRIGIDLGGTKIEAIVLDENGATLLRRRVPTPNGDYVGTLNAIADLVLLSERELCQNGSLGVASPGAISTRTGLLKNSNSTVLNGRPLDRDLSQRLGRPIRLENDANCFALSEATTAELNGLRTLREQIQQQLSVLQGGPRFYYGGSFGKKTMIKARYDLDLVMYWPHTATYSISGIYTAVGDVLKKSWKYVNSKTCAWELPFQGGFHIDIVPGRALDAQYYEANLHRTDTGTTLKTSLKKHIDIVRNSGRTDAIRLIKLWRVKKNVPFKKSFLLELMTIDGCKGKSVNDLEAQVLAALKYIRDTIRTCSVSDPANSNNSISDDLDTSGRLSIQQAADAALKASFWSQVF